MRLTSLLSTLVGYIWILPLALADDAPRLAIGKVVLVTPQQDQSLAWPYDLEQVNSLQFATDANSTYDRVPSLSYNGKTELSIMYFSDDAPGRTDRIDMALIQGNKEGENITSFRYVVCNVGVAPGVERGVATATITLLDPGPTGKAFVSPTSTADYVASCTLAALPPMKTT